MAELIAPADLSPCFSNGAPCLCSSSDPPLQNNTPASWNPNAEIRMMKWGFSGQTGAARPSGSIAAAAQVIRRAADSLGLAFTRPSLFQG